MQKILMYGILFLFVLPIYSQQNVQQIIDKIIANENFTEKSVHNIKAIDPELDDSSKYLAQLITQKKTTEKAMRLFEMLDPYWNYSNAVREIVPQLITNFKTEPFYRHQNLFCECLGDIGRGARAEIAELIIAHAHSHRESLPPTYQTLERIYPKWNTLPIVRQIMPDILTTITVHSRTSQITNVLDFIDQNWRNDSRVHITIPHLVTFLESDQQEIIERTIEILKDIDPCWAQLPEMQSSMPKLVDKLQKYSVPAMIEIVHQMGKFSDQRFAPVLIELYQKHKFNRNIIRALGNMTSNGKAIIPILTEAFKQTDTDLQIDCLRGLLSMENVTDEIFSNIVKELETKSDDKILNTFAKTKNPKAIPFLLKALKSKNEDFVVRVLLALKQYGPTAVSAKTALQQLLEKSQSQLVRQHTIAALAKIEVENKESQSKESQILQVLQKLLTTYRKPYYEELKQIDPQWKDSVITKQFIDKLAQKLEEKPTAIVIQVLNELGPPQQSFSTYAKLLDHEKTRIVQFATQGLTYFEQQSKNLASKLMEMLTHYDVNVAQSAWETLDKIDRNWLKSLKAQQLTPYIAMKLDSDDGRFREYSTKLLMAIGENATAAIPNILIAFDSNFFSNDDLVKILNKINPQWRDLSVTREKVIELQQELQDRKNYRHRILQQIALIGKKEDADIVIPFIEENTTEVLMVLAVLDFEKATIFCKTHFDKLESYQQSKILKVLAKSRDASHARLQANLIVASKKDTITEYRIDVCLHPETLFRTLVLLTENNLDSLVNKTMQKLQNPEVSPQARKAGILFAIDQLKKPIAQCFSLCTWLDSQNMNLQISDTKTTNDLWKLLEHRNWFVRCTAVKTLWQIKCAHQLGVDKLLTLLQDREPEVKMYALRMLGEVQQDFDVTPILRLSVCDNSFVRNEANQTLATIQWKKTPVNSDLAIHILEAAQNENGAIVASAYDKLRKMNFSLCKTEIALYIMECLDNSNLDFRVKKITDLMCVLDPQLNNIAPIILQKMKSCPEVIYTQFIWCVAAMGDVAIDTLIHMYNNPRERLEYTVPLAINFHKIYTKKAIDFCQKCLQDSNSYVRTYAAQVLIDANVHEALPEIVKLVHDKDVNVRTWVIEMITKMGRSAEKHATVPLILALTDSSIAELAEKALQQVCPEWDHPQITTPLIPQLIKRLDTYNTYSRRNTAKLLTKIDSNWTQLPEAKNIMPVLLDRYVSSRDGYREGFIELFEQIDPLWFISPKMQQIYLNTIAQLGKSDNVYISLRTAKTLKALVPHFEKYVAFLEENPSEKSQQQFLSLKNTTTQVKHSIVIKQQAAKHEYIQKNWQEILEQLSVVDTLLQNSK